MGLFSTIKKGLSWGFAPRSWIGTENIKAQTKICKELASGLVSAGQANSESQDVFSSSFTPEQIKQRKLSAVILGFVYVLFGIGVIAYAWYLFFSKTFILAGFVSLAIAMLLFVYGLREGMVYVQLHLNRNRVTLREFLNYIIKGLRP